MGPVLEIWGFMEWIYVGIEPMYDTASFKSLKKWYN